MNRTINKPHNRAGAQTRKKAKFPLFWVCVALIIEIAIIIFFAMRHNVLDFLKEYESVQPKYMENAVFDEYFASLDWGKIASSNLLTEEGSGLSLSPYENESHVEQYLGTLCSGKEISGYGISSGVSGESASALNLFNISKYFVDQFNSKGQIKYIVKAGEDKIAEFTLDHSDNKDDATPRGFMPYKLTGITMYCYPHNSITLRVPDTSVVYLNGIETGEDKIVARDSQEDADLHMTDGAHGIRYVVYHIDGLYLDPTVVVRDKDGNESTLEYDTENEYYTAVLSYSSELENEYSATLIQAIENYAAYMQSDGNRGSFMNYYDTNSQLWRNILSTENYFVIDHSSWSFEDQRADEFYAYSDNVFSCRVRMTHKLHRYGFEDYVDYIDMTLYLHRCSDGVFRIYDSFAHE